MIEKGAIGDLRSIVTHFSYFNDDPQNIRNIPGAGGGALLDVGCYAISAARLLFGSEPSAVKGAIARDSQLGTDMVTSAVLDFGGRHSLFTCSTQTAPDQRMVIHGSGGKILIESPFTIPSDKPKRFVVIGRKEHSLTPHVEVHKVPRANSYALQVDTFSMAIRTNGPTPIPPWNAVANVEVIERIVADAEAGNR